MVRALPAPPRRGGGALPRGGEPSEARLGFKLTLPLFPFSKTARRERLASKTSSPRLSPRLACLGVVMRVLLSWAYKKKKLKHSSH